MNPPSNPSAAHNNTGAPSTQRWPIRSLGLVLTLLATVSFANAAGTGSEAQGTMRYVSGGIGLESQAELTAMARDFNIKLVFALNSGAYLSDVQVVIVDAKGKTVVDARSDGPWFMVRLPTGNYRLMTTYADQTQKRAFTVDNTRLKTIDLRWSGE